MDLEQCIRVSTPWEKLPLNIKQSLGHSEKEYEKATITFSMLNQLKYRSNLVRQYIPNEEDYYSNLVSFSRTHLMLYPYHLGTPVARGLRLSAPRFYFSMLASLMSSERGYDTLPNFTAADCARLLGVRRNQYIDALNRCKSSRRLFRRRAAASEEECLAELERVAAPVLERPHIEPWWLVRLSYVTNSDVTALVGTQKEVIDKIIDNGPQLAGAFLYDDLAVLFKRDLIYFDVPVEDDDILVVPPLEGFVMNCVGGDYLETLLYKVLVALDAHTPVAELAKSILQVDLQLVKNAVSVFLRLGFAHKKNADRQLARLKLHASWSSAPSPRTSVSDGGEERPAAPTPNQQIHNSALAILGDEATGDQFEASEPGERLIRMKRGGDSNSAERDAASLSETNAANLSSLDTQPGQPQRKRIALLYDSTLTAYLMMGNLSQGLKKHAVTMFEIGKLPDEQLTSFLEELDQISWAEQVEGEVRRYFEHAITLRESVRLLRALLAGDTPMQLDLVRCESLKALEPSSCQRLLQKNYLALFSMAPVAIDSLPPIAANPPHFGPPLIELHTPLFKLWLYATVGSGPVSLYLTKSQVVKRLPRVFWAFCEVLLHSAQNQEASSVSTQSLLMLVSEQLRAGPVFVQSLCLHDDVALALPATPADPSASQAKSTSVAADKTSRGSGDELLGQKVASGSELVWALLDPLDERDPSPVADRILVPFPFTDEEFELIEKHRAQDSVGILWRLSQQLDLRHSCGYITLLRTLELSLPAAAAVPKAVSDLSASNKPLDASQHSDSSNASGAGAATVSTASDVVQVMLASGADADAPGADMYLVQLPDGWLRAARYVLLDMHFGVPLFDQRLNRLILERVQQRALLETASLEKQAAASARLAIRFQRFLHELAPVEYSIPTEQTASEAEISSTKPLIEGTRTNRQPCSLLFVNGRLFPFQAQN